MSKSSKKAVKQSVEEPVSEPVQEPVVSTVEENVQNEENEATTQVERVLFDQMVRIKELAKMGSSTLSSLKEKIRDVSIMAKQTDKRYKKLSKTKRSKPKNNSNSGLQQLKPIYTQEMREFVENHRNLTDKHNNVIFEGDLSYDSEHLLISRNQALKLVNAYVRVNKLQDSEQKRKINMDKTMNRLFPELSAVKDKKGKVTQEENCYYQSLMGAIARHFREQ